MSAYEESTTTFTDAGHLCSALKEMGYEPTRHPEPVHLHGYHGDTRPDLAHIVVPRSQIGSSANDIGFLKVNGVYRAVISQYDQHKHNATWMGKLAQAYKEKQCLATARAKGYVFQGKTVLPDGKVQLRFGVRG